MVPQPQVVPIRKPLVLRRGYYFKTCRPYRTISGVRYDYKLYNWRGKLLKTSEQGAEEADVL